MPAQEKFIKAHIERKLQQEKHHSINHKIDINKAYYYKDALIYDFLKNKTRAHHRFKT